MDVRKTASGTVAVKTARLNAGLSLAFRIILGVAFLYAGIIKLRVPLDFADSIASFRLLPVAFINPLAITLPAFEAILGAMLLIGFELRTVSLCTMALSCVFAVAIASALARGLKIDCGCFGNEVPSMLKLSLSLGRDIIFAGMAWVLMSQPIRERSDGASI